MFWTHIASHAAAAAVGAIIGAGIVGTSAGDLIGETALAIEMGATLEDLVATIHPHPTLSETVNFAAGSNVEVVTIPVSGDADIEDDETFSLALTNAVGGTISATDNEATGTILNDDLLALRLGVG